MAIDSIAVLSEVKMVEIWETKKREIFIRDLMFAGMSKRFSDGKLTQESVHIGILGGPEVNFPSEYWHEVKSAIDGLLKEI